MKYLRTYENINWDKDWDFEDEDDFIIKVGDNVIMNYHYTKDVVVSGF